MPKKFKVVLLSFRLVFLFMRLCPKKTTPTYIISLCAIASLSHDDGTVVDNYQSPAHRHTGWLFVWRLVIQEGLYAMAVCDGLVG